MSNICSNADAYRAGEGFESFGYSILNMVGFGSIVESFAPTTLDKIKSKLQQENAKTQQLINNASLEFAKLDNKIQAATINAIKALQQVLEEEISYHNEVLREDISLNTNYIMYLYIILIVVYIYLLLK